MKVLNFYFENEEDPMYKKLVQFAFENGSNLNYEEKETTASKNKSEKIRPWTMPFGKHKGKLIEEIPDSYLVWQMDSQAENIKKRDKGQKAFVLMDPLYEVLHNEFVKRGL